MIVTGNNSSMLSESERQERRRARSKLWKKNNPERVREVSRKWRESNKEKTREYKTIARYGLNSEQVSAMRKNQASRCAICGGALKSGKSTHIDHDHRGGKVRGILCRKCNTLIGLAKENIAILHNAISYLQKHNNGKCMKKYKITAEDYAAVVEQVDAAIAAINRIHEICYDKSVYLSSAMMAFSGMLGMKSDVFRWTEAFEELGGGEERHEGLFKTQTQGEQGKDAATTTNASHKAS